MIAAVVLAAGRSTRMGRPKQTLPLQGVPMLEKVLNALRRSKVDLTVVVLGAGAEEIKKEVTMRNERVVINHEYRRGLSESLKLGLKSVKGEADAVLVVLADQPFFSPETVNKLLDAYLTSGAPVVAPVYKGHRGNPVLFDKRLYPRIMLTEGDMGARAVVDEYKAKLLAVNVDDEGVVIDLDTPSEYARAALAGRTKSEKNQEAS